MNTQTESIHPRSSRVVSPTVLALAAAILVAIPAVGFTTVLDDDATETATSDPVADGSDGAIVADGTYTGRVIAAYVAPNELVFAADGSAQQSLPVSPDVTITDADGNPVSYDDFTMMFDGGSPAAAYRLTITDGFVTAIAAAS